MLPIITCLIGVALGWVRASRRKGSTGDKVQYAIGYGLAFGLAGLILGTIFALNGLFPGA